MQAASPAAPTAAIPIVRLLVCAALVVTLGLGVRHGFGLWLQPISIERGWNREVFAFAMAVQNLTWGVAGLFAGMLADRFGAYRVIVGCTLLYAAGLAAMPLAATPSAFALAAGVLIGAAQAGTTFGVVYGVIGRNVAPDKRSWAMGVAAAAGSFGQFAMVPVENAAIAGLGWKGALFALAAASLLVIVVARGLREPGLASGATRPSQSIGQALREALATPSFLWLTAGFFVCGFQLAFIGVHLPSDLKDRGLGPGTAATALALIGLANVAGTYAAGVLGARLPKRYILSAIYALRSLSIVLFLAVPLTPWSVYAFATAMGLLWLSTVPPTNATVAQIFGVQYLSTLGGIVFLSHQVGSFLGVWLGGRLFDATGSYRIVWWIAVALGLFAALVNLPVREQPLVRRAAVAG